MIGVWSVGNDTNSEGFNKDERTYFEEGIPY
jgi:hypothetical protein